MDCQKIIDAYKVLFSRIKKLKPFKDDSIFIKVENCIINIIKRESQLSIDIANLNDRKEEMMIIFADFPTFQKILSSEDLNEYGERLLYAVLDRKVLLDPGTIKKATDSGFYKLLSRSREKKHIRIFELTIPVV